MGARSWSERRSQPPPQPPGPQMYPQLPTAQPQQHYVPVVPQPNSTLFKPSTIQERQRLEAAARHDHQVRMQSVQTDLMLDLPSSIPLSDGEEHSYGSMNILHLRDPEQESEIYCGCIRPPPNRTIPERESPPPYRSGSVGILHKNADPSCHERTSDGSSLVMQSHSNRKSYPQGHCNSPLPFSFASHLRLPTVRNCRSSRDGTSTRVVVSGSEFADYSDPPPRYSDVVNSRDFGGVLGRQQQSNGV